MREVRENHFDVVIIGGAIAGASSALLLQKEVPGIRIAIVEKSEHFKRRVGESTVEVSAAFLGRKLGLSSHLNRKHLCKQGLRFYFTNERVERLSDCSEVGSVYCVRIPGYQVDRAVLDEELLRRATTGGAEVFRPCKVTDFTLYEGGEQKVVVLLEGVNEPKTLSARWVVDGSGLAATIGRKTGKIHRNEAHPISSVWARFEQVGDWDSREGSSSDPWRARVFGTRDTATNHIVGKGYWIWVIPLKDGAYSLGLVYDERLVTFPKGGKLGDRLKAFISQHPAGAALMEGAHFIEGDVAARSLMPYRAEQFMGDGWALVGDSGAFIDPFYSPGLDWLTFSACATSRIIARQLAGKSVLADIEQHNQRFSLAYERWFEAIYQDKYYYMGDHELMNLAFRLDLGTYYFGVVQRVFKDEVEAWELPPFTHQHAGPAFRIIRAYNRALARIGKRRMEEGRFGTSNDRVFSSFNSFQLNYTLPLRLLKLFFKLGCLLAREQLHRLRRRKRTTALAEIPGHEN